jgi:hypothetical protein
LQLIIIILSSELNITHLGTASEVDKSVVSEDEEFDSEARTGVLLKIMQRLPPVPK